MNRISNNNNFGNVISIQGLVDSTSNGEKFGFRTHDVNSMVNGLCYKML